MNESSWIPGAGKGGRAWLSGVTVLRSLCLGGEVLSLKHIRAMEGKGQSWPQVGEGGPEGPSGLGSLTMDPTIPWMGEGQEGLPARCLGAGYRRQQEEKGLSKMR